MEKSNEKWILRLELTCQGVWNLDFRPPFLWSLYLVTRDVGHKATGLGINKDTPGASKAVPLEATDPKHKWE